MFGAINIQAIPTPTLWEGAVSWTPPADEPFFGSETRTFSDTETPFDEE